MTKNELPYVKGFESYRLTDRQTDRQTDRASVAQWAKPLLIGHSACWPDGLRTLADLGKNPGLEEGFSARLD